VSGGLIETQLIEAGKHSECLLVELLDLLPAILKVRLLRHPYPGSRLRHVTGKAV
jgi:hypothetical protein